MAHSSPDMAQHRQAGKKETRVNQHGEQDLREGKQQNGEGKITFHYVRTQGLCSPQLRDHKLRSTALYVTDSSERAGGEADMNFPAILICCFTSLVSPTQLLSALDRYYIVVIHLTGSSH